MYKITDLSKGRVNIPRAYERALSLPEAQKQIANLRALKGNLEAALEIKELAQAKELPIFEIRTRLKAHLLKVGRSPEYARNQNSALNFVLRSSPLIEDLKDFGDWGQKLDRAILSLQKKDLPAKIVSNFTRARDHLIPFFLKNEIAYSDFSADIHMKQYRTFLRDDCALNPGGNGRLILNASKVILLEIGLTLESVNVLPTLPRRFQKEIELMGKFATQTSTNPTEKRVIEDPFAEVPGEEQGKIRPITWNVRKKDLERYLRYWLAKEPKVFEDSHLKDWLNETRLKEFLTHKYKTGSFSAATAETCVSRLVQFMKYANAAQVGGFQLTDEELARQCKKMWALVGGIRKHFRKSTVSERLTRDGGVPKWEELHEHFESALIRECTEIERLKLRAEKNRTEPKGQEQARALDLRIAIKLRDLIQAAFHLYGASRPHDPRQAIRASALNRVSAEYYSLYYLPSKTSGKGKPAVVDMCLPPWMTPIIEVYLERYRPLIFDGTDLLFPADERLKRANANVAHEGAGRFGNSYAAIARLTKKYFGKSNAATKLRYSLAAFFSLRDLGGLYLHLGHRPDKSMNKMSKLEHESYLRKDDHQRIKIAIRHYAVVAELLKDREKLELVVKKIK